MNLLPIALKIGLIGTGYLGAVIVATAVALAILLLQAAIIDGPSFLEEILRYWSAYILGGLAMTAIMGFPGFLAVLLASAVRGWRDWPNYAKAGGLNAIAAVFVGFGFFGPPLPPFHVFLMVVPGGVLGGVAFWAIAGRRLTGGWKMPA